ncbi:MAG: hypothetical protein LBV72_00440 [Tannerella sp.]|jgi:hypothetical protein|nr:hypothetical protein [Tannerella sp.]
MEENVKEQPVYKIGKVKIKGEQLTVDFVEDFVNANYHNDITKSCQQIVHSDLKYALGLLKPHVVQICEMPEAKHINVADPSDEDLNERLKNYVVTGYSKGGDGESAGVTIIAQKLLSTGKVLNLTVPFMQFADESGEGYPYGSELEEVIARCDYEVDAYLFEEKWGIKQETFDFDTPVESDITGTEELEPKKKSRKKKESVDEENRISA